MTLNPDFKYIPLFDVEYLRNGTRYKHSYNALLCDLSNDVIFNDLK